MAKRTDQAAEKLMAQALEVNTPNPADSMISGKNRDDAFEASGEHLAEALKTISTLDEGPVREIMLAHDQALREQLRVLRELSEMQKGTTHDIPMLGVGLQAVERQMTLMVHKTETTMRTLVNKEVVTEADLEKTFKEEIAPEYIAAMQARAKELGVEVPAVPGESDGGEVN